MVNLATLKQVGQFLVDIHGQHDQEDLMKASHHQAILDAFGDSHFKAVKLTYQELFDQYKSLRKKVIDKQKMSVTIKKELTCFLSKWQKLKLQI